MLWRPAYQTLVARNLMLPSLDLGSDTQILVGAFDFQAIREMSLWRRLVEADAPQTQWAQAFFFSDLALQGSDLVNSIVPPSQRDRTFVFDDNNGFWSDLVKPDRADQAFAAVISGEQARIMMKGVPTEDAWDAFLKELN